MENDDMANKPKRELWGVVHREGSEKDFWTRIGTAFENKDASWNLLFDYFQCGAFSPFLAKSLPYLTEFQLSDTKPLGEGPLVRPIP